MDLRGEALRLALQTLEEKGTKSTNEGSSVVLEGLVACTLCRSACVSAAWPMCQPHLFRVKVDGLADACKGKQHMDA